MATQMDDFPISPQHPEFTRRCGELYELTLARICVSAPDWMLEQPAITVPVEFTSVITAWVKRDIKAVETLRLQPYLSIVEPDNYNPYQATLAEARNDMSGHSFLAISGIYTQTTKRGEITTLETPGRGDPTPEELYLDAIGFVRRMRTYTEQADSFKYEGGKSGLGSRITHMIWPEYSPNSVVSVLTPRSFLAGLASWLPEMIRDNEKALNAGLETRDTRIAELSRTSSGTLDAAVSAKIVDSTLRQLAQEKKLIEAKLAEAKAELRRRRGR